MEEQNRRVSLREELQGYTQSRAALNISNEIEDEFDFINHRRKKEEVRPAQSAPQRPSGGGNRPVGVSPRKAPPVGRPQQNGTPKKRSAPPKKKKKQPLFGRKKQVEPPDLPLRQPPKGQPSQGKKRQPSKAPERAGTQRPSPMRQGTQLFKGNMQPRPSERRPQNPQGNPKPSDGRIHPNYTTPYQNDRARSEAERRRQAASPGRPVKKPGGKAVFDRRKRPKRPENRVLEKTRTQTKNYRQEQRRREIFNENTAEINRRIRLRQEFRIKQRQNVLKVYFARTVATLILFLILFSVVGAAFFISLPYRAVSDGGRILYRIGSEKDTKARSLSYDTFVRGGVVYVRGDDIVSLCNMTIIGDAEEVKYISADRGNETVSFIIGTSTAYVNKNQVRISAPTFYENDIFYIPLEFFTLYASGLNIGYDTEAGLIYAERIVTNAPDVATLGVAPVYAPINFTLKSSSTVPPIDETAVAGLMDDITYKIDISAYEQYINPADPYAYLSVINASNPASATFTFDDLTDVSNKSSRVGEVKLRLSAQKALEAMLKEARAAGKSQCAVFDGYQTLEGLQAALEARVAEYTGISEELAYERALRELGNPYENEKLLGLSADVYFGNRELAYADSDLFRWFEENAYKFGYIIRYPEGKEASTGVSFAPWTLRFVGRYHAIRMRALNYSLEEYTAFIAR